MDSLLDAVRAAVADIAGVPVDEINATTTFGVDLDIDSLDLYEVVNGLEQEFSVTVDDNELYDLDSVGDLAALIERLRSTD